MARKDYGASLRFNKIVGAADENGDQNSSVISMSDMADDKKEMAGYISYSDDGAEKNSITPDISVEDAAGPSKNENAVIDERPKDVYTGSGISSDTKTKEEPDEEPDEIMALPKSLLMTNRLTRYNISEDDTIYKLFHALEYNAEGMTGLPQATIFLSALELAAIDKISTQDKMRRFAVIRLLVNYGLDHLYPGILQDVDVIRRAQERADEYLNKKRKGIEKDRQRMQ